MRVFAAGGRLRTMYPVYDSIIKWRKKVLIMMHCADDWTKMATDDDRKEDGVLYVVFLARSEVIIGV